ncbi:MAG: hypothetical protein H6865_02080 [Rhodospirillales bacterium]|nr:hypothetical protein [Alphaproteobacteria bacterium]MCB9986405.1 hypothetical protein [Rhodospirillales bacterium]USO07047.1 MAG: hypothetical protein H6866_06305 [Rhodospirillales bacterium]
MKNVYFQLSGRPDFLHAVDSAESAAHLAAVQSERPALPETPPSPWIAAQIDEARLVMLDTAAGRETLAGLMGETPLYRLALELLIDRILLAAQKDDSRMKGVRQAFAPEDAPEAITDTMAERHTFEGTLHFPIIATRSDAQLIDLYLRLFGAACPEHRDVHDHLAAMLGGYPGRLSAKYDGLLWRGAGWVRLDRLIYEGERLDYDPDITFESYVARGRAAAESLATADPESLLAAWVHAERVQRELCRDIDCVLKLPDIRRLPRWVRSDVFRILEREAMKQVFAEALARGMAEWPGLRHARILAEPIEANARGEVAPLIQQLLNQTLSADARYAGAADAFALQAERRWSEARKLIGKK